MSAPRCFPGRVINSRYRLDEVIGKGQVATVYRAHDLRSDRACALKILNAASARDASQRERLAREGALASRLCHQNLPLMYALDEDSDGTPFLVMELLEGPTLHTILRQQGRLSMEQALQVLEPLIRGVACAHALGVLHRDLKPQNILLVPSRREPSERSIDLMRATVKLIDFGLAGEAQTRRSASIRSPLGLDMEYRAPELLSPAAIVDTRADQWSLGVIAYEVLAGVRPFSDADPVRLALQIRQGRFTPLSLHRPDLPPYMTAAVERALSLNAEDRFASVADFGRALRGQWPRMFRIATPTQTCEADIAGPADLFAAVIDRQRPGRDSWLLRTMALATLAMLAFAIPFSWVGSVTSMRGKQHPASVTTASPAAVSVTATTHLASLAAKRTRAVPFPPLRAADPDPMVRYPQLRLIGEP